MGSLPLVDGKEKSKIQFSLNEELHFPGIKQFLGVAGGILCSQINKTGADCELFSFPHDEFKEGLEVSGNDQEVIPLGLGKCPEASLGAMGMPRSQVPKPRIVRVVPWAQGVMDSKSPVNLPIKTGMQHKYFPAG